MPNEFASPSRVILGGGGSEKTTLLKEILKHLEPGGIIVIPLVTLEQLDKVINLLKQHECDLKISQHHNFRGLPLMEGTRLFPMNPVFIVKGKFL